MIALIFPRSLSRPLLIEYHMTLWCSLSSWHNNYISRALSLQPIQHFSIRCLDPYRNVMSLTFIKSISLVISCSYNSFQICHHKAVICCVCVCVWVSQPSSWISVYRPADTCGGSPKALKSIKNSSVARWCLLNQFCVILQMHSASLTELERHESARNECGFWKLG